MRETHFGEYMGYMHTQFSIHTEINQSEECGNLKQVVDWRQVVSYWYYWILNQVHWQNVCNYCLNIPFILHHRDMVCLSIHQYMYQ